MSDDILNPFTPDVQTSPVSLDDLVVTTPLSAQAPPEAATRNRAAQTALLSPDPKEAMSNYNTMLMEQSRGNDSTYQSLTKSIDKTVQSQDFQSLTDTLSNPNISLDQKKAAAEGFTKALFLNDKGTTIHSNLLQAEAKGETPDAEIARISTADSIREIYDARTQVQGLKNKWIMEHPDKSVYGATSDFLSSAVPFSDSKITNQINKALEEETKGTSYEWDSSKTGTFFQPGFTKQDMAQRLRQLPPEQQVPFAKALLKVIGNNSNLLFGNDNQFQAFQIADQIFDQGGYSNTEAFLDNVFPLMDIIGVGSGVRTAVGVGKKLLGGAKAAEAGARAEPFIAAADQGPDLGTGAFNPKARPKASPEDVAFTEDITDVPFTETARQPKPSMGPNRQIDSGIPKLTQEPQSLNNRRGLIGSDVEDQTKRISRNAVVREENPATVGEIAQHSNPTISRNLFNTATQAVDDQASEAIYGVNRLQATANGSLPQAATETRATTTKVNDINQEERLNNAPDPKVINVMWDSGGTEYSPTEKAAMRANVVKDFQQAEGLTMNEAMSSFEIDGGRLMAHGVYEVPAGSFSNAQDAMNQAKFALRNYGIQDSDIKILRKEGLDHVPYEGELSALPEGDYKLQVSLPYEFHKGEVDALDVLDVKRNWFDRFTQTQTNKKGSLTRYLFDAASIIHPRITQAAEVGTDLAARFEKVLLQKASEFTDDYAKFPKPRQAKLDDYLREANYHGIDFDQADLIARGFNAQEISAVKKFRDFWDTHFYLENFDIVRSLNRDGYQLFDNGIDKYVAKPIAKNGSISRFYDPASGSVRQFTTGELDALYNNGGTLARFRRPVQINGQDVEHMISRQTPTEYLRGVRDTDHILNYRKGYYQLSYKAPIFVDKVTRDANGAIKTRSTVAVAGDTPEAEAYAKRMQATTGEEHITRADRNALHNDSDEAWDLNVAGGRIAQRYRGKLLNDAGGLNRLGDGSFVLNPAESATKAAKSIAGRTIMRPVIESAKERFMQQYSRYIKTEGGLQHFPKSLDEIVDTEKNALVSSEIADARSSWAYIRFLEDGYINSMDQFAKGVLHSIANTLGERGYGAAERGVRLAGEHSINQAAKGSTSFLYIASNVARQLVIQPAQAIRMIGYNPKGIMEGTLFDYFNAWSYRALGIPRKSSQKELDFLKFIDKSGLMDAVDKSNLVRGTLMQAADQGSKLSKLKNAVSFIRQIGFDTGESINLMGHAAAVYDRYSRLGRNLSSKEVQDAMHGEIRALSFGMNSAGDMPYNQTSASMIFQFMQSPHKALLQATNRRLDPWTRTRMALVDTLLWGVPITGLINSWMGKDFLPDNQDLRGVIRDGLIATYYNKLTEWIWDSSPTDLSSLDPRGLDNLQKMGLGLMSGGVFQMITNSPAGSFFLKDSGRFQKVFRDIGRHFGAIPEYDNNDPQTFQATLGDIAKMSSGVSNGYKAWMMIQTQKRLDAYGNTIDQHTTTPEIVAQFFGFGSMSQKEAFDLSQQYASDIKAHKEDALKVYKLAKQYYADKYSQGENDPHFITAVTGAMFNAFANDPEAAFIVQQQMMRDFSDPANYGLLNQIIKRSGMPDTGGIRDQLKGALDAHTITPEDYQKSLDMLQYAEKSRDQLNETVKKYKEK